MNTPIIFGALVALSVIIACVSPRKPRSTADTIQTATHYAMSAPQINTAKINYTGNPNRIGAYVYVMEANEPDPSLDWAGTFIGMQDGMALVRDTTTHVVTHVNRDQVYAAR